MQQKLAARQRRGERPSPGMRRRIPAKPRDCGNRRPVPRAEFRAGAFAQDISPTKFPAPVNGSMSGNFAKSINDPMHARCLALSDGRKELIFCVVDACMISRDICEEAKCLASKATGVPASHMLISATHTHSAATMAAVFQSDPDPDYVAALPARIAEGLIRAHRNLEPAEVDPRRFRVRVMDGEIERRVFQVEAVSVAYTAEDLTEDFPDGPGPEAVVAVAQYGPGFGWGAEAQASLIL